MNQFMTLLSIHPKHILPVQGPMPLPKYLCESKKTHIITTDFLGQEEGLHHCHQKRLLIWHYMWSAWWRLFRAGINWWKSHLNVRLINLIVITVFRGTKKGLQYLWPVLDMNWAYFCFLGIFKPMWSLILQKDFYFGLCVLP